MTTHRPVSQARDVGGAVRPPRLTRAALAELLAAAGLRIDRWITDATSTYALVVASLNTADAERR